MLRFYQLFVWQLLIVIVNCDNLLVNTKSGPVRGVEEKTFLHKKKYLSYKGIPYAKPPVGELRFRVFKKKNKIKKIISSMSDLKF